MDIFWYHVAFFCCCHWVVNTHLDFAFASSCSSLMMGLDSEHKSLTLLSSNVILYVHMRIVNYGLPSFTLANTSKFVKSLIQNIKIFILM